MVSTVHAGLSRLRTGDVLKIRDGSGQILAVFDGLVWVTQDGDPADAFISKGATFTFDRSGLAIVEALSETRLAVLTTTEEYGAVDYGIATTPDAAAYPHVDEAECVDQ
jgi:hypothetical protein